MKRTTRITRISISYRSWIIKIYKAVNLQGLLLFSWKGDFYMPTKIYNEINNFVIKAKKLLGDRLKKIILYGSYARGDYNTRILNTF